MLLCVVLLLHSIMNRDAMFLLSFYRVSVLPRLASDFRFSYLSLLNSEIMMVYQHTGLVCDTFVTLELIDLLFSSTPSLDRVSYILVGGRSP